MTSIRHFKCVQMLIGRVSFLFATLFILKEHLRKQLHVQEWVKGPTKLLLRTEIFKKGYCSFPLCTYFLSKQTAKENLNKLIWLFKKMF